MKKILVALLVVLPLVAPVAQGQTPNEKKTNDIAVPPAMTKEQIFSLLDEKKHIPNQLRIADVESFLGHFKSHVAPKEYPLIIQQVAAIDSAGKSKDKAFTPYLIDYLDYVGINSAFVVSARTGELLSVRRERRPALNALININSPKDIVLYIESNHPLEKRFRALAVLTDIDYDQAVSESARLLQDDEVKKNPKWVSWINDLMKERLPTPAPVKK